MFGHQQIWEAIALDIKEQILNGLCKPGDRLKEIELAEKYSVSKTPVREALRYLGSVGFIEIVPHRMACVKKMNRKDIENLFRIQAVLEGLAGRDAIPHVTKKDLRNMEKYAEQLVAFSENKNHKEYEKANINFHEIIWNACNNKTLVDMIHNTHERLQRFRSISRQYPEAFKEMASDHRKIVEAALKKDGEGTERLFRMHIERYQRIILRLWEQEHRAG